MSPDIAVHPDFSALDRATVSRPHILKVIGPCKDCGQTLCSRKDCGWLPNYTLYLFCPYEPGEGKPDCRALEECSHVSPEMPEGSPPPGRLGTLEVDWGKCTPEQEREWRAYFTAEREWGESHPDGPLKPVDECWAVSYGELWDAVDAWGEKLTPGEHLVRPRNDGYIEESRLILEPWEAKR